jgi:hypothetical protein
VIEKARLHKHFGRSGILFFTKVSRSLRRLLLHVAPILAADFEERIGDLP